MAARKGRPRRRAARPAPAEAPAAARRDENLRNRVIEATMELIAGRGWRNVALGDIATASGLSLAQLYAIFPSRLAVLDAFERQINEKTLEGGTDATEPVRDRVFDLIMRRLDALAPYKAAVRSLLRDLPYDPAAALCTGPRFLNAMRWMAESAGIETGGIGGLLRVNGLAAVYLSALRTWLDDDSADNARTMAALDRALRRAEFFIRSMPGMRRAQPREAA